MANNYKNHLRVIPEDDKYNSIINGIKLSVNINSDLLDDRKPCGGCEHVFKQLTNEMKLLKKLEYRYILILIDFDEKFELRYKKFESLIPSQYQNRIFILGVNNKEFEDLQRFFKLSNFEKLAKKLVEDCPNSDLSNWKNKHLECNIFEIKRMKECGVFDWLFNN